MNQKKLANMIWIVIGGMFAFGGCIMFAGFTMFPAGRTIITAQEQQIIDQFSAWDGSHKNLTIGIKHLLKDPESYQNIDTKYWVKKDHIKVAQQYRSKNSFGGYVEGRMIATFTMNGDLIEILASE